MMVGVAAIGVTAVVLLVLETNAKASATGLVGKDGTAFQSAVLPGTTQGPNGPLLAPGAIIVGDKLTVDVFAAGLNIPGVPAGQNLLCQVTAVDTPSTAFVQAVTIDPRVPDGTPVQVLKAAITGDEPAS